MVPMLSEAAAAPWRTTGLRRMLSGRNGSAAAARRAANATHSTSEPPTRLRVGGEAQA